MLVGHQKQWQFLKNSYQVGKLSHAYLFSGPKAIGKKSLAIEFVKFLNCQAGESSLKPCQNCRACQDIEKGVFPDFVLIEPEVSASTKISTVKEEIKIAQIREMEKYLSLYPYLSSFKIAVIDKAHSLTQEAQNSFLKTLEEPKGNTLFILITEYPEMLLETILSRVQKINFYPVNKKEIENYLKSKNISDEKAKEIAEISLGKIGEAIDFIKNPQKLEEFKNTIKEINKLTKSNLSSRFQYARNLTERKKDLKETLDIWLRYFREILIQKLQNTNQGTKTLCSAEPINMSSGYKLQTNYNSPAGGQITNDYSLIQLRKILETIQNTDFLLSTTNVNPKLALEILMLEL